MEGNAFIFSLQDLLQSFFQNGRLCVRGEKKEVAAGLASDKVHLLSDAGVLVPNSVSCQRREVCSYCFYTGKQSNDLRGPEYVLSKQEIQKGAEVLTIATF